jgi:hypothetical protein
LYCDNAESVVNALRESLTSLGYQLYDPFGAVPGKAYPQAVRLFVAPASDGWVRVIGEPDPALFALLSHLALCLSVALDATKAEITAFVDGSSAVPEEALVPHLRPGRSPDDLRRALNFSPTKASTPDESALPLDTLPQEVQAMANQVNLKQAQNLFSKLSGELLNRSERDAARQMLKGVDWNSPGGQRVRALMPCLTVPKAWREPDFVTLRDAYALHLRRQRNPNAMLFPGDQESLAGVPDALAYTPVYGGRNQ